KRRRRNIPEVIGRRRRELKEKPTIPPLYQGSAAPAEYLTCGLRLVGASAEPPECPGELARDDPHLVRLALGELRQHLQVLVGEQLGVRLAVVDRLEDRADRLRLPFRLQDHRLPRSLG